MNKTFEEFSTLHIQKGKRERVKRQYSISSDVLAFRRCRRQYGMYRVRCYRPAKTIQFYFGTVIHQTLDLAHEHYLGRLDPALKATVPTEGELESYFLAAESSLRTRGIVPFSRVHRESALKLLKRFNKHYGPVLYPRVRDTECRLQMDLGQVVMQGVVDVLMASTDTADTGIWDYKGTEIPTGERMEKMFHDYELQMKIYSLLYANKFGQKPKEAILVFLNELKSDPPTKKEEQRAFLSLRVGPEDLKAALQEFMQSVDEIENERSSTGVQWAPPPLERAPERRTCQTCDFRTGCVTAIATYGYESGIPKPK